MHNSGESVSLTPITQADADAIAEWKSDHKLSALMAAPPLPTSREQASSWISAVQTDKNQILFGIRLSVKSDSQLIGILRLMYIDWVSQVAELGLYLGNSEFRGRSIGRLSLSAALDHAFIRLNFHRIWLRVISSNEPALKLYRAAGFIEEGRLKEHFFADGAHKDMIVMGLLRSQYRQKSGL